MSDAQAMKCRIVWGQFVLGLVPIAFVGYVMKVGHEWNTLYLYAGMSLLGALLYALDKVSASAGSLRVSESTLRLVALLGGWPGLLVTGPLLRHKTRKRAFLTPLWAIVAVHVALWGWLYATHQTLSAAVAHLILG